MGMHSIDIQAMAALEAALAKVVRSLPDKRDALRTILNGVDVDASSVQGVPDVVQWATAAHVDIKQKLGLARQIERSTPGIEVVKVTDEQIAAYDVPEINRIDQIAEDNPTRAAVELEKYLKTLGNNQAAIDAAIADLDESTVKAMGQQLLDASFNIARQEQQGKDHYLWRPPADLVGALERVMQLASPSMSAHFADDLLKGAPLFDDEGNPNELPGQITSDWGLAATLKLELRGAFNRLDQPPGVDGNWVGHQLDSVFGTYSSDLSGAQEGFRQDAAELAAIEAEFQEFVNKHNLSGEELASARRAFEERNADVFADFEASSATLAMTLDAASRILANDDSYGLDGEGSWDLAFDVMQEVERLSYSDAGIQALKDAMDATAGGRVTWISRMQALSPGWDKIANAPLTLNWQHPGKTLANALIRVNAVTSEGSLAERADHLRLLQDVVGPLLGDDDASLEKLIAYLDDPRTELLSPDAFATGFADALENSGSGLDDIWLKNDNFGTGLFVLQGSVLAAKWIEIGEKGFSDKLNENLKTLAETLALPRDVAELLAGSSYADLFLKSAAGNALGALTVPFDLVAGVTALQNGDEVKAGLSLTTVGGTVWSVASKGKSPWGIAIAAFAEAGNIGLDLWRDYKRKQRLEREKKEREFQFLLDAGWPHDKAHDAVYK